MDRYNEDYRRLYHEMELILDNIPALIFYKDLENNFLNVNKYVADAHHLTKDQMKNKSCFELYPPQLAQEYWNDDLKVASEKKALLNREEKWETEKEIRWVSTSKIPIINQQNSVDGIIGISIDITDQKKIQEDLQKSKENLDKILENLPLGIIVVSSNREIISINKSALELFGYENKAELIGKKCFNYVCQNIDRCPILHEHKHIDRSEKVVKTKLGKEIIVLKSVLMIEIDGKTVLIEAFMDIQNLKETQQKLEESERKFRYVVENSQIVLYRYNFIKNQYDYISPASVLLFGYTPDEIIQLGIKRMTSLVHPNDRGKIINNFNILLKNKSFQEKHQILEFRFKHKFKGFQWLKDHQILTMSPDKKPQFLIGNIVDIHLQKVNEEIQKDFQRQLEKRVEERTLELTNMMNFKNNFYSAISHELRTPLNTISGFIELLSTESVGPLSNSQKEILSDASKSSQHLIKIVQDILEISYLDNGKKQIRKDIMKINHLSTLIRLVFEEHYKNDNISFNLESKNMNENEICIDSEILIQIFRRLFDFLLSKPSLNKILTEINIDDKNLILKFEIEVVMSENEFQRQFIDFDPIKSLELVNTNNNGLNIPIILRLLPLINGKLESKYYGLNNNLILNFIFENIIDIPSCK